MTKDEEARIRADEREKERERCAAVADEKATEYSIKQKQAFDLGRDITGEMYWGRQSAAHEIASAIRSGADSEYVCVRREELEHLVKRFVFSDLLKERG